MTRYGVISDTGDDDNHLVVNDDDAVDTVGHVDPYLQTYVSIPPTQDVIELRFIVTN